MCRRLGHVGPAGHARLAGERAGASLLVQTYAPADMRGGGTVNADGFGVGWYVRDSSSVWQRRSRVPVAYRRDGPMWTDRSFLDLAPIIRDTVDGRRGAVGDGGDAGARPRRARRSPATAGGCSATAASCRGWPESSWPTSRRARPAVELLTLDAAPTRRCSRPWCATRLAGASTPATRVAAVVTARCAAAPGSRLNLLLGDGERALGHRGRPRALGPRETGGAVTVASEPLDRDPDWHPGARPGSSSSSTRRRRPVARRRPGPDGTPSFPTPWSRSARSEPGAAPRA